MKGGVMNLLAMPVRSPFTGITSRSRSVQFYDIEVLSMSTFISKCSRKMYYYAFRGWWRSEERGSQLEFPHAAATRRALSAHQLAAPAPGRYQQQEK